MSERNAIKWATSSYLYNHHDPQNRWSFSTEDDGVDGIYNPRFAYGKQVTRTPKLDKYVIIDIVSRYSNRLIGFYDPWYTVHSLYNDYDRNDNIVQIVVIRNKVNNTLTKWSKGCKRNSIWKKIN